nr:uncharacterized mitochondrial protein AtMg00860-like [Tanacetum cinerariifolium]
MNKLFHPFLEKFVVVYLDDIVVYSHTLEEHVLHLKQVFHVLQDNELYVKLEKCTFAQDEVEFLGHKIKYGGLMMDDAKIKAIQDWEPPTKVTELRKKDGSLRMCIDYRELNKVTIKNKYAIPLIADLFDQLGKARYSTKLDLRSSHTLEGHVLHLKQVFHVLQDNELYVKLEKCTFAQDEVEFLGHKIKYGGLMMDDAKIKAIQDWEPPTKVTELRYHFIKEQVENGVIELYFVNTEYQLADLFTKALGRDRIEFLTTKLGIRSFTPETLKQLMNEEDE